MNLIQLAKKAASQIREVINGQVHIFVDSADGKMKYKDEDGNIIEVGGSGASLTLESLNIILDGIAYPISFEKNITIATVSLSFIVPNELNAILTNATIGDKFFAKISNGHISNTFDIDFNSGFDIGGANVSIPSGKKGFYSFVFDGSNFVLTNQYITS